MTFGYGKLQYNLVTVINLCNHFPDKRWGTIHKKRSAPEEIMKLRPYLFKGT